MRFTAWSSTVNSHRVAASTPFPKHLDIFKGAALRLLKPLSNQFSVRVCSCPLCIYIVCEQDNTRRDCCFCLVTRGDNPGMVTLRVEYVFTYSCDAAIRIWIPYSAWWTLCMTGTRTYSRLMYSQNRLNMNRISYFLLRSAYSTGRMVTVIQPGLTGLHKRSFHFEAFVYLFNHPYIAPPPPALPTPLQYYCTTIAQYTTPPPHMRPPPWHTPYNIGNGNIV